MDTKERVRLEDAIQTSEEAPRGVKTEQEVPGMEVVKKEEVVEESEHVQGPNGEWYLRRTALTTYQIAAGVGGRRVWDPVSKQVQEYLYVGEEGKGAEEEGA